MYSIIQMAKRPAIIATIAATPPFVIKEVAADEPEVVGAEAAELAVGELVGTEPVAVPPLEALGVNPGIVNGIVLGVALGPVGVTSILEDERIRNRALKTIAKKNRYQYHILSYVWREQFGYRPQNSAVEDKQRRRLGIERWCTRTLH